MCNIVLMMTGIVCVCVLELNEFDFNCDLYIIGLDSADGVAI